MEINIQKTISKSQYELRNKIEIYLKLHIKPKPKWLPKFIWYFILSKLLVLEQFNK